MPTVTQTTPAYNRTFAGPQVLGAQHSKHFGSGFLSASQTQKNVSHRRYQGATTQVSRISWAAKKGGPLLSSQHNYTGLYGQSLHGKPNVVSTNVLHADYNPVKVAAVGAGVAAVGVGGYEAYKHRAQIHRFASEHAPHFNQGAHTASLPAQLGAFKKR